jgi:hypothetical protein
MKFMHEFLSIFTVKLSLAELKKLHARSVVRMNSATGAVNMVEPEAHWVHSLHFYSRTITG